MRCIAEGCERNAHSRQRCKGHRIAAVASGEIPRLRYHSPEQSFSVRVRKTETCWEWTGAKNDKGYGQIFGVEAGRATYAHRWSYEHFVGPIPEGLELDHLCCNPGCVRPDHLEPVTHRENTLRSTGPAAVHAEQASCVNGHPFNETNTYTRKGNGARMCRACGAARQRKAKRERAKL